MGNHPHTAMRPEPMTSRDKHGQKYKREGIQIQKNVF